PTKEAEEALGFVRRAQLFAGGAVMRSGLWELVFQPRITPRLRRWVSEFDPDIIYAVTPDLGFMKLCLDLSREFHLPYCLDVLDDYPGTLYKHSPAAWLLRPRVVSRFSQVMRGAGVRMAAGYGMADEYNRRYKVPFHPILHCESLDRFVSAVPERLTPPDTFCLLYSGSLYLDRWRSLLDIAQAVARLSEEGLTAEIHLFTSKLEPEAASAFSLHPQIVIHDIAADDRMPGLLKGADVLLL